MSGTRLWPLASLAIISLISVANGAPLKVMLAPNLLRVGTAENIFVECQDCSGGDLTVNITVKNHTTKNIRLAGTSVTLKASEKFQKLVQITIPADDFNKDPKVKQYVYLQAQFPDQTLEKVVLVSFQSGYIFIQTDKTIYTPNSKVLYRLFAVTPRMEPVERNDQTETEASVAVEIVTPDNIVLPVLPSVSLNSGIYSGNYHLEEIISPGLWKIVAKFPSNPQESYSAEFEVKEYVLPSFEVKLTPEKNFFYVDSEELDINIKATYLFGEEVDGAAYVVFGVVLNNEKKSFPGSIQRVMIDKGDGAVTMKREHITQTFPSIRELVGSSIYVSVSVLTESGGEMVEAELRGIQIVTSPYTIHFKRTPKYFKPEMPLDVLVEVVNPDETPAAGVPVVVEPGSVHGTTAANGLAKLTVNIHEQNQPLSITAKTNNPRISVERQAQATMVAQPYTSSSNSYIHIGVNTANQLEDHLQIKLTIKDQQSEDKRITYLIVSRGQIIRNGHKQGSKTISFYVPIKKDMLPSFRVVAYYHRSDNEVVSDSVWVDVKDTCMGSLKLESSRPAPSYEPRKKFVLKITGDPEATVGLVAVDKGVYVLNNKHRLTQKKVWDVVEKYDTGCTPGGGKDSMGVFYDAGLLFESSTASGTPYRRELKCPAPHRRKRATTKIEVTTSLLSQYKDELERDCCKDGMSDIPVSYTCERRSEYIVDGAACVAAFLHCCKEMASQQADKKEESLVLARSEEDDNSYLDSNEIVSRTNFPESWFWQDIKLPACPEKNSDCKSTSFVINETLQDSITTWQFTGISLSRTQGICVGDPLEVIVRKEFFIDLRLPYSAVRGEQIEIKAILHNYLPEPITVRIDLIETENVCSAASKHKRFRQEVKVGAQTTRAVPFVIIPMKNGAVNIEVRAAVKDTSLTDGIRKKLLVVPQGVLVKSPRVVTLNPVKRGAEKQEEILNSAIPLKDVVPNTPTSTQISVTGRENIGPMVENAISGQYMGELIQKPSGCGEQNLMAMILPVIATLYLDRTNQWKTVGLQKRNEALEHIRTGFVTELTFRKADGSFSVYTTSPTSTWLTAYVVTVFSMASKLVTLNTDVICEAAKYLILNTQKPDGMFREVGEVYHGALLGHVEGAEADVSMTALCLIALQDSRQLCSDRVNSLPSSIDKAVSYLERRLPQLTNPYAVAMASYALANEGKLNQGILNKFAAPELTHWPVKRGNTHTLEATAYALLALVKALEDARPVVRWFNNQQKYKGGYGSTQATKLVYQAVAEYWANATEPEYNLNVTIELQGKKPLFSYNFSRDNHYATRTSEIHDINQDIKVTATGTGEATFTMVSLYYALPKVKESDCQKFDLTVEMEKVKDDDDVDTYKLNIEVMYKDRNNDATMSILDIGLLTGFTPNTDDLNALSKGRARIIAKYEMNTVLSERGSLIIYLDKVSCTRPEIISFRVHQKLKVGVLQPAAVSVYEYYNQRHCVQFYHPKRIAGELLQLCRNNECTCAEENCSMQKKDKISNDQRTAKLCESTQTSKIDFVYKVRLEEFKADLSTDVYTMRILNVTKEGSSDFGPENKLRTFLSYRHCRETLDLSRNVGKTYLIMGTSTDTHRDEQNHSYQYVLGERTWIEYWPTEAECQTEKYRVTCLGLEEMEEHTCEAK